MGKPQIDWECVAHNLKAGMEARGVSMRDLQKEIGVDKATLSRICAGKRCTPEAYVAVCVWMKAKPTYFFTDANEQ